MIFFLSFEWSMSNLQFWLFYKKQLQDKGSKVKLEKIEIIEALAMFSLTTLFVSLEIMNCQTLFKFWIGNKNNSEELER